MTETKYVYSFGGGSAEGRADMKNLLGGKGANLAEMATLGIPVPAGFTLTTEVCTYYYDHGRSYPPTLEAEANAAMAKLADVLERFFVEVLVMTDDERTRANRIALLKTLGTDFLKLADLSKLQIEGGNG